MVREDFDDAFEGVDEPSNELAGTERSGDSLEEVVEQRVGPDRPGNEVTQERTKNVPRLESPTPDVVELPRRYVHTERFGKIAAAMSVALLLVAGFLAVRIVQRAGAQFPLVYVDVDEFVDGDPCQWTVRATVRNESDRTVRVTRMETVVDRTIRGALETAFPTLEPGNTAVATGVFTLRDVVCTEPDDIDHGNLILQLDDGTRVSRGW